ncbi:hypothetical protein LZ30DRAFT_377403 [Colletotrichum cereale]|nr:hypothetical protein LZ30DRAFT_377403 [Colletotrichum cereale]
MCLQTAPKKPKGGQVRDKVPCGSVLLGIGMSIFPGHSTRDSRPPAEPAYLARRDSASRRHATVAVPMTASGRHMHAGPVSLWMTASCTPRKLASALLVLLCVCHTHDMWPSAFRLLCTLLGRQVCWTGNTTFSTTISGEGVDTATTQLDSAVASEISG